MPSKPRRKSSTKPAARRRSARNSGEIRVTASFVGGGETTRTFKTLGAARELAQYRAGTRPELGSSYAVSSDGIATVRVTGASLADLFPDSASGRARREPAEWTGPIVGRRSHESTYQGQGRGDPLYGERSKWIEVLPTDVFERGTLTLADGTWVSIEGDEYTDAAGTEWVTINGHYTNGPTWEEIAGGSRTAAAQYVDRYDRKPARR